jgi:acyl-CoA synthetase (AMP-forming)/AMP-acid ligase II
MSNYRSFPDSLPSTLVELLRYRARQQPAQRAYTFLGRGETEDTHLTYGELDRKARIIGRFLQREQAFGKPVLLLHPPGLEYIAAFFGCLYAGAMAVPAYPPRSARMMPRVQAIVADTQADIALTTARTLSDLQRSFDQAFARQSIALVASDSNADCLADEWVEPQITQEALAFLQYTSGSTSMPRGVMVTHRNLLHNLRMLQRHSEQTAESHMVSWLPPYHDLGLIGGILFPLYGGYPSTMMAPVAFLQSPFRWLRAISSVKATISSAPNFAYDLCIRSVTAAQRATLDLSHWSVATCAAEPVSDETLRRFSQTFAECGFRREAFFPAYGLAEATLMVASAHTMTAPLVRTFEKGALEKNQVVIATDEDTNVCKFIGYDLLPADQEIRIVHPEALTQCSVSAVGEIWVSSHSVAAGYWQNAEETQKMFQAYLADTGEGPFLRTGDLGFLKDGALFITGRLKDVIVIHGRNHYPQDIELTVEKSHGAIRPGCCAAFSFNEAEQERLAILVEIDPHYLPMRERESQPAVIETSRRFLDGQAVIKAIQWGVSDQHELQPSQVILLKAGSVLKTSSGKLQRRACRAQFLAGSLAEWDAEN